MANKTLQLELDQVSIRAQTDLTTLRVREDKPLRYDEKYTRDKQAQNLQWGGAEKKWSNTALALVSYESGLRETDERD